MPWKEIAYALFICILLLGVVGYAKFFKLPGISTKLVLGLLVFKFVMAVANYYYISEIKGSGDSLQITEYGYKVCSSLYTNPDYFYTEFVSDWGTPPDDPNFLSRSTRFWEMLGVNIHRRLLILLTFISFGFPYISAILFSFFSFIGQLLLYKAFTNFYPYQKTLMLLVIFCFPSAAFWISGISKESYMAISLGLILYSTVKLRNSQHHKMYYFIWLLFSFIFLFWIRNFYLLSITPFYLFWLFFYNYNRPSTPIIFISAAIIGFFIFLASSNLPENNLLNFYHNVSERQAEFIKISHNGGTTLELQDLKDKPQNFLKVLGQSLNHVFLRPYPNDVKNIPQLLEMINNWFFLALVFASMILSKRKAYYSSFFWFIVTFSFSNLIMIGLTVPNIGAISRYKTIFILIFLLSFIGIYTNSNKISENKIIDN